MSLTIISNYAANVAHGYLTATDANATESLAKLSSGQRIVSAKDDPAGLSIGSNLAAQLAALQEASTNAGQATSMLQVADGALSQIGNILTQMKSLAVQASSGQLDATNRAQINTDYQALLSQVDQIANDTTFNGVQLLAGTTVVNTTLNAQTGGHNYVNAANGFDSVTFATSVAPTTSSPAAVFTFSYDSSTNVLTATNLSTGVSQGIDVGSGAIAAGSTATYTFGQVGATVVLNSAFSKAADIEPTASNTFTSSSVGQIETSTLAVTSESGGAVPLVQTNTVSFNVGSSAGNPADVTLTLGTLTQTANLSTTGTHTVTLNDGTNSVTISFNVTKAFTTNDGAGSFTIGQLGTAVEATAGTANTTFNYKIGPGVTANDTVTVSLATTTSSVLGIAGGDVNTTTDANTASTAIDTAINTLNTTRAGVGASENRLTFVSANLATSIQNVDAARSSLLDVDVASEMTNFSNLQVLEQTGIAMLAQANQMPQHLLRLFQ